MKIARIVLTATILFSLKSTLFAAQEQAVIVEKDGIPSVRRKSFDALRDSNLLTEQARIQWALDHDGENYTHWRTECQVRPGSDIAAQGRWEHIGRSGIKTVENAQKFLGIVARHNLQLSQDATQPSLDIIKGKFDTMQQTSRSLIASIAKMNQDRALVDKTRNQFYAHEILKITQQKTIEFFNRDKERAEENTKFVSELKESLERTKEFRLAHNEQFPKSPIVAAPVVKREDINQLNTITLAGIAARYNAAILAAESK